MLIDTNVFLEILLKQALRELCKQFIIDNLADICISDFTLHSIGVVAFRKNKANLFTQFTQDMLPHLDILTLPKSNYAQINTVAQSLNLDFDDAYQYSIAKCYDLELVTLDKDFKDLHLNDVKVIFFTSSLKRRVRPTHLFSFRTTTNQNERRVRPTHLFSFH